MPVLTLDSIVAVSGDAVFRELDGESVVLNLETGLYYGLDEVGTRIWRAVDPMASLRIVLESVVAEFNTDRPAAEADLLELAAALLDKGLWTLA